MNLGVLILRLLILALSIIFLASCTNSVTSIPSPEIPSAQDISPPPSTSTSPILRDTLPRSEKFHTFTPPVVDHPYAEEMIQLLTEFSTEALFPEFENLQSLDFWDGWAVSTNLYVLTLWRNEELISQGRGITEEQRQDILERYGETSSSVARHDDLTFIGRQFFGEDFYFPRGVIAEEIAPLDPDSEYYYFTSARGGVMGLHQYLLVDVIDDANFITATFVPYFLSLVWNLDEHYHLQAVQFRNFNFSEDFNDYRALLSPPILFGSSMHEPEAPLEYYLQDTGLPVPQEELGTITVTFRREDSGNLIVTSSRYNRR